MDSYVEDSVSISNDMRSRIIFYVMIVVAVLSLIFMFAMPIVFVIPFAAACVLAWYFYLGITVDYDYTLVNDSLDIAKIRGKSRRKLVISLDMKEADIVCKDNAPELGGYASRNPKVIDVTSPEEEKDVWVIITSQAAGNKKILFQPSDEMISEMKRRNPSKVIKKVYG